MTRSIQPPSLVPLEVTNWNPNEPIETVHKLLTKFIWTSWWSHRCENRFPLLFLGWWSDPPLPSQQLPPKMAHLSWNHHCVCIPLSPGWSTPCPNPPLWTSQVPSLGLRSIFLWPPSFCNNQKLILKRLLYEYQSTRTFNVKEGQDLSFMLIFYVNRRFWFFYGLNMCQVSILEEHISFWNESISCFILNITNLRYSHLKKHDSM